uniref:PB1 domain-containing protein n=1 Tax=Davidia involucrata TaxID=16924 RepID=A0A5B7BLX0_DAVIN
MSEVEHNVADMEIEEEEEEEEESDSDSIEEPDSDGEIFVLSLFQEELSCQRPTSSGKLWVLWSPTNHSSYCKVGELFEPSSGYCIELVCVIRVLMFCIEQVCRTFEIRSEGSQYALDEIMKGMMKHHHLKIADYIPEFFLPSTKTNEHPHPRTLMLDSTMKHHHLPSFKVASGEELGVELSVEAITFDSFQICQTTRCPTRPEAALQNGGEMVLQLMVEDVSAEQRKEGPIQTLKKTFPLEDIIQHFEKNLEDAAKSLRVSRSTLKRNCREHGITQWPSHKRNKVNEQGPPCSSLSHGQTVVATVRTVTIVAIYKDDLFKFEISVESGMVVLEEEIAKRIKVTSFKIKYFDEDGDLVSVACDEDLWRCMDISRRSGKNKIEIWVQPITN